MAEGSEKKQKVQNANLCGLNHPWGPADANIHATFCWLKQKKGLKHGPNKAQNTHTDTILADLKDILGTAIMRLRIGIRKKTAYFWPPPHYYVFIWNIIDYKQDIQNKQAWMNYVCFCNHFPLFFEILPRSCQSPAEILPKFTPKKRVYPPPIRAKVQRETC